MEREREREGEWGRERERERRTERWGEERAGGETLFSCSGGFRIKAENKTWVYEQLS